MHEKDILLVINPNSSKGRGKERAEEIKKELIGNNRGCVIAYSNSLEHACELAEKGVRYGYKTIVAAGGDGTVNAVMNGIMKSGSPGSVQMGIIPTGRGNDFAWFLEIPKDIRKAIDIILSSRELSTDVGYAVGTDNEKGRYFFNGLGMGFEAQVNSHAMAYKKLNGMASYVAAFLYVCAHIKKPNKTKMIIDGVERDITTQQISVCNGRRMGSSFILAPDAEVDDGELDVVFTVKDILGVGGLLLTVLSFFRKAQKKGRRFEYLNAREVSFDFGDDYIESHIDGEIYSDRTKHVDIRIIPKAIRLLTTHKSFQNKEL